MLARVVGCISVCDWKGEVKILAFIVLSISLAFVWLVALFCKVIGYEGKPKADPWYLDDN